MGGKGSGRSGHYKDLDFRELLERSLTIQLRFFKDPSIPDEKKVEYASRYLMRRVGDKIDLAIEHHLAPQQLEELKAHLAALKASKQPPVYDIDPPALAWRDRTSSI